MPSPRRGGALPGTGRPRRWQRRGHDSMPANRSARPARRKPPHRWFWLSVSTLTQKCAGRLHAGQVCWTPESAKNPTSGGSREMEVKLPTVIPTGPCRLSRSRRQTDVGTCPSARRNVAVSKAGRSAVIVIALLHGCCGAGPAAGCDTSEARHSRRGSWAAQTKETEPLWTAAGCDAITTRVQRGRSFFLDWQRTRGASGDDAWCSGTRRAEPAAPVHQGVTP